MPKYRYLGPEPRHIDAGGGGWIVAEPGDVIDLPDDGRYIQCGATGEPALFEKLAPAKIAKEKS